MRHEEKFGSLSLYLVATIRVTSFFAGLWPAQKLVSYFRGGLTHVTTRTHAQPPGTHLQLLYRYMHFKGVSRKGYLSYITTTENFKLSSKVLGLMVTNIYDSRGTTGCLKKHKISLLEQSGSNFTEK